MSEILRQLESTLNQYRHLFSSNQDPNSKPAIAAVVRLDIYNQLKKLIPTVNGQEVFPIKGRTVGLPIIPDPAADSIAMAQTEECMMFYNHKALTLYLNRANEPLAWVRYCCECAGIPYPVEDEPIPPSIGV